MLLYWGGIDFVNLVSKVAVFRELRLNFASILRELHKIKKQHTIQQNTYWELKIKNWELKIYKRTPIS